MKLESMPAIYLIFISGFESLLLVSYCISSNSNYAITVLMDFCIISGRNRVSHYWIWNTVDVVHCLLADNPFTCKRWPTILILEIKNLRKKMQWWSHLF